MKIFATAINRLTSADDRAAAVRWLGETRKVVGDDSLGHLQKLGRLQQLTVSRENVRGLAERIAQAASDYKHSTLPLPIKIAIPATLAAVPFIGGQAAGLAAFGGALGVPVLLLVFLGVTGITSVIEAVITNPEARVPVAAVMDIIIEDERIRRTSAALREAVRQQPQSAQRADVPAEELALRRYLLEMDPFEFERHVMSFFKNAGLEAWVTSRSNDFGVDGGAVHDEGLIVVQCKRNSLENKVGSEIVQQFKGVIEEQNAFRGYIVTTSQFSSRATESAAMSAKMVLVPMDDLIAWHQDPPRF